MKKYILTLTFVIMLLNGALSYQANRQLGLTLSGLHIYITDILAIVVIFIFILYFLVRRIKINKIGVAILLFLIYLVIPSLYTVIVEPTDTIWMFRSWRGLFYYLLFFPLYLTITTKKRVDFLTKGLFIGILLSSGLYLTHYFTGHIPILIPEKKILLSRDIIPLL